MNKLESFPEDSMNSHSDESLALIIMTCQREGNCKMQKRAENILQKRLEHTASYRKEAGEKPVS